MCHFRDDTIEAAEVERELRDEYVPELENGTETTDFEDTLMLADGN
jgi:hypothetical protein